MTDNKKSKLRKFTSTGMLHIFRLVIRSCMFLLFLAVYIDYLLHGGKDLSSMIESHPVILSIIWLVFIIEMIQRSFPAKLESPGSQKQFARNYMRSGKTEIKIPDNNATMLVALLWVLFNAIFGALYLAGILDDGFMILLACAFSVCDMICILFFCPFQSWFLKNKCCGSCRIYNWDYAMMFTPLFFVQQPYTWSLLFVSLVILFRWEVTVYRHPERFSEDTNEFLLCANCTEKLCSHKKQLHKLWKDVASFTGERAKMLARTEDVKDGTTQHHA